MTTLDQAFSAFETNHSISMNAGATMDLNVNQMIQFNESSIKSFTTHTNGASAETDIAYKEIESKKPFTKLFPVDTIVKSNRPNGAGIKHAISGDIVKDSWVRPTEITYAPKLGNTYRTYYASSANYYKYWVSFKDQHAALKIKYGSSEYPKDIRCNKIVLKFETSHAIPSHWYIYGNNILLKDGTSISTTGFDAGVISIYWTGTNWSTSESDLNISSTTTFSSIAMGATNPGGYIAVIELAPHLIYDLTNEIIDFTLNKETSSSTEDLLAVGNVTANSLTMNIGDFNNQEMKYKIYEKLNASPINENYIYLLKNSQINVFYKIYNNDGDFEDFNGKYFKLNEGVFFIDSWSLSNEGAVSITALDSAKILQEIICPQMLCESYTIPAIIRRMLDTVGFTNYKINYNLNQEKEKSITRPDFWWSEGTETVWSLIQDLCRDSQMIAFVDNNNILQFYTRDYIFDSSRTPLYELRNDQDGDNLPNIISLNKNILPGVNNVKIIYYSAYKALYEQNNKNLVEIGNIVLAAAGLSTSIANESTPSVTKYMQLDATDMLATNLNSQQIALSYSGFFLIDSEVIEFDAIQYEFIAKETLTINGTTYNAGATVPVDITSSSDLSKYRSLAQTDSTNIEIIKPNSRYRIKTRGAFGTKPASHVPGINMSGWNVFAGTTWVVK
jgi:hypothetical protein